jgi:hypothetical protein
MGKKKRPTAVPPPSVWHEINDVYDELRDVFYRRRNRTRAAPLALRLLRLLDKAAPENEALLAMAGRSLIAEVDGDFPEAIRYKRMEVAALKPYADRGALAELVLSPDEYSDRLDQLACLHLENGQYPEALAALDESERYCTTHGIPFDGEDVRRDVLWAMKPKRRKAAV